MISRSSISKQVSNPGGKKMAKGVKHYFRDGTAHSGGMHKMPNGTLHSGARHTSNSKRLYHFGELSKTAQKKARSRS